MQTSIHTNALRNDIADLAISCGLDKRCYAKMLDYTIQIFEENGLGADYYGYHNINHELEVTYVTLLASQWKNSVDKISKEDLKYLFVAALFHDFDPQKTVDKPHEESVLQYISLDTNLKSLFDESEIDFLLIQVLILCTTYPWSGDSKRNAEKMIERCFKESSIRDDQQKQIHFMKLGWYLSVVDRISGYALGDFTKGMELAKMNAHALAWHPSLIVKRSVAYFEDLLSKDIDMYQLILSSLPKPMRKNVMDNILSFMHLRQKEIQIQADYYHDDLKLVTVIEKMNSRLDDNFIESLLKIYDELPRPLQFTRDTFEESIKDEEFCLNTLRLGDHRGEIIGFAKGGPLEKYNLRPEITDENYGKKNTIFLEPISLKMGYWGLHGGKEMRHLFVMQAQAKKYKFFTSFSLRDVIRKRMESYEDAEFVQQFDPERWDYYRITL